MNSKKAIYSIFGMIIFIIVATFVAISLIGFGPLLVGIEENINEGVEQKDEGQDILERVMFCYGSSGIIDSTRLSEPCTVGAGYGIQLLPYGVCGDSVLLENGQQTGERMVFFIPVSMERGLICMAKLEIYA